MKPQATRDPVSIDGTWRIYAYPAGQVPQEITFLRGSPIDVGDWVLSDPFGPQSATLSLPQVTVLDAIGRGELSWLAPGTNVDIVWDGAVPTGYPDGAFRWEGYMTSFEYATTGLTVTLIGAMYQLDNYLAKPSYPTRPIPYENALLRQWERRPDLRLRRLRIEWPDWWTTVYTPQRQPAYLIPSDVVRGQRWSGLVTRDTGSWGPVLTQYMQTLLASMYTSRGRFTIDLAPYRSPVLRHRDFQNAPGPQTLVVDPAAPGVEVSLSYDPSQSLNVVYTQGTSISGEGFSGLQVSGDGERSFYLPAAALRTVDPVSDKNGALDPSVMRKEVLLQFQDGLDARQAAAVGQAHLQHFVDAGLTGSITLKSDPAWNAGGHCPRALIKAGMSVQLLHALGRPDGILLHVVSVTTSLDSGSTTLTVDSRYRDALTVDEVRLRGRDARAVTRRLIGGEYVPPIPDQLLPWNYAEGSGYLPGALLHGSQFSSLPLFADMPDEITFPWESWTTAHPPSAAAWRHSYIEIGPTDTNHAYNNWAVTTRNNHANEDGTQFVAFPIRLSQVGNIRLVQIAAYDINGNVMKVPFHVGIYAAHTTNPSSMPKISTDAQKAEAAAAGFSYGLGDNWPFFTSAFDNYTSAGTQVQTDQTRTSSNLGVQRAWGTNFVPAGYWPGLKTAGDTPTGLLVDDTVWPYNLNNTDSNFSVNPYQTKQPAPEAGYAYVMIYCEAQGPQPVYFLGRLYRQEPGTTT